MTELKVVLHINQNERFNYGYKNTLNLANSPRGLKVSLVLTGEAIKFATYDKRIKELLELDVEIKCCNNSLNNFGIDAEDLIKGVGVVPSGGVELIEQQNAGFAYIKP